ncbi:MAG: hypothetical protein Q9M33_06765, partial [Robiginitomaculum sp.]|nr:hypothetical protein [Robiginitomaculum sp.]
MSNLSQAQLTAPVVVVTAFVRIDLPGYTLRVWTGIGDLTTMGQTFTGIGDVGTIGAIEEGMDGVAPRVKLALAGIDPVLRNEVEEFVAQGSPVFIWYALADRDAGTLLATPDLAFTG